LPLVVLGAMLLLPAAAASSVGPSSSPLGSVPQSCGAGLALIAVPTTGPAPLLDQFSAVFGAPSAASYNWTFGDGTAFSGVGTASSSLAHLYRSAGDFLAQVNVTDAGGVWGCSLSIVATEGALQAEIVATPVSGAAPLTVHFVGAASNGTDTYDEFIWEFGDGGAGAGVVLNYTYLVAGSYTVSLLVVDSSGASATATAHIVATVDPSGGGASPSGGGSSVIAGVPLWEWVLVGGVVLGGLFGVGLWRPRRPATGAPIGIASAGVAPAPDVLNLASEEGSAEPAPHAGPIGETLGPPAPPPEPEAHHRSTDGEGAVSVESVRLSQRIIGYLGRQDVLEREGTVPREYTQRGMAEALGVRQGPLSNVLRRLVAAGVLTEELRHVRDAPRRLKAYRLTPEGRALARELNARRTGSEARRRNSATISENPGR